MQLTEGQLPGAQGGGIHPVLGAGTGAHTCPCYTHVCPQVFSIVVFGSIVNEGYLNSPSEGEEFCIYNRNPNACSYGVAVGVLTFLTCLLYLALDVYFPQISSVKDRKKAVLSDIGVSGEPWRWGVVSTPSQPPTGVTEEQTDKETDWQQGQDEATAESVTSGQKRALQVGDTTGLGQVFLQHPPRQSLRRTNEGWPDTQHTGSTWEPQFPLCPGLGRL